VTTPVEPDRLYDLLPGLYRISDVEQGLALQALLRPITGQADAMRDDIAQLWDDFFIETCQRWVVPYIGDLVGNHPLHDLDGSAAAATAEELFTDLQGPGLAPPNPIRIRADVAKTIAYRRRKGTPAMLEALARDVTGWPARVVEFFALLSWNQHLEHRRPDCHGCPDLRSVDLCDRVGGPWDTATHTIDVRAIAGYEGWYGIPNIGFFLWRLRARPHTKVQPRQIGSGAWRFTFSPLGNDTVLFCGGRASADGFARSTEPSVPAPIRPAAFFTDLAGLQGGADTSEYYGQSGDNRVVVYLDNAPVLASDVMCANLEAWSTIARPTGNKVLVDVARGRLALSSERTGKPTVSYCDGFAAELGGGQYGREKWLAATPPTDVVQGGGNALQAVISAATGPAPVIQINDNLTYELSSPISLAPGQHLTIQAHDGTNPHVLVPSGELVVAGGGPDTSLTLNGLLVEGGVRIDAELRALRVLHCTLVPGRSVLQEKAGRPSGPSVVVTGAETARLEVQIAFSIVGALRIPEEATRLWVLDSIVDGVETVDAPKGVAIGDGATSGPPAHIERSTIFGATHVFDLELGSESLFTGLVTVNRREPGCVRFSYVFTPPAGLSKSCKFTVSGLNLDTTNLGAKPLDEI